ncbi:hypothetical protein EXIGLDRAFT_574071, partial [Exidia glandulosa HHB12029]
HLTPAPSPLRPHCSARERLILWRPATAPLFPLESAADRERILNVLSRAWKDSTLQTYGSGLLIFHVFCDSRTISEALRAPASREVVSLFITALAGMYSQSAISNYVAALSAWHVIHRLDWQAKDSEVVALIRGAAATAPPRKPPRPPFTVEMLDGVLAQLDHMIHLDVAVAAALTIAFWATCRTGEVTVPNLGGFDPLQHPTRAGIRRDTDRNGNVITVLRLPRTKSSSSGEDVYWAVQAGRVDPSTALHRHLAYNNPANDAHIFSYR